MVTKHLLDDALELAELLRPAWAEISDGIPAWHPRYEGEGGEGGEGEGSGAGQGEGEGSGGSGSGEGSGEGSGGSGSGEGSGEGEGAGSGSGETDWKAMSRKHERDAKKARKERDDALAKQKERDDAAKTEHEKALDKAREEGKNEALTASQKERRADRLEVATTRLAAKGVKVGDGDDAKTVKFADPEDAMVHIERAIDRGDVDADDIFDNEGKVHTDALTTALSDLLERKPHLKAADNGSRAGGSSDAGTGSGSGKDPDEMSIEEHEKRKYARK